MLGDVVPVLVGEDELAVGAVLVGFLVAAEHDPVLAGEVAGLGAEAALVAELEGRVELHREQADLGAVDQRADEVGDLLRIGVVAALGTGRGDADLDRRFGAVADRIALRRRSGRDPPRRNAWLAP